MKKTTKKPKMLLERAREVLRQKHYSIRTEASYIGWMRRYILFHNKKHPREMRGPEIEEFLSHLAMNENVASSTKNQAFNALLFLYRNVLGISLQDEKIDALRARKKVNLPVVLTKDQVKTGGYHNDRSTSGNGKVALRERVTLDGVSKAQGS